MRLAATVLLWLLTTAALAVAVPAAWTQKKVVEVDGYAAMARKAAGDPALQSAMASELATRAIAVIKQNAGRGTTVDSSLVHGVATGYTNGPSFPADFAQANRLVHDGIFAGAGKPSSQQGGVWVIDLAPMLESGSFQQMFANFNVQPPSKMMVPLTVSPPSSLRPGEWHRLAAWSPWVSIGAAALTGIGALLTLAAAPSRGKALAGLGVSALLVGAGGWAAVEVTRREVGHALNYTTGDVRRIADVMVAHAVSSLHQWLDMTLAAGGVLVVFGVIVAMVGGLRNA